MQMPCELRHFIREVKVILYTRTEQIHSRNSRSGSRVKYSRFQVLGPVDHLYGLHLPEEAVEQAYLVNGLTLPWMKYISMEMLV